MTASKSPNRNASSTSKTLDSKDLKIAAPFAFRSGFCQLLGLAAVAACLLLLIWLTVYMVWNGYQGLNPAFIFGGFDEGTGMFDTETAGVFPMVVGTLLLVMAMTILVIPVGVITAVYLHEYADREHWSTRILRLSINNLAGVPSIIFGLFGLGFFVYFMGGNLDRLLGNESPVWGKPALIWASFTMAVLTIPVVVVATEEALRAIPQSMRDASTGLGASPFQTLQRLVLPRATPGILTGAILAISRGAGEVAPIMFVGATYFAPIPRAPTDQFMELGYHIFILATQSPDVDRTRPLLFATVVVLLLLTFCLNLVAMLARFALRNHYRSSMAH